MEVVSEYRCPHYIYPWVNPHGPHVKSTANNMTTVNIILPVFHFGQNQNIVAFFLHYVFSDGLLDEWLWIYIQVLLEL